MSKKILGLHIPLCRSCYLIFVPKFSQAQGPTSPLSELGAIPAGVGARNPAPAELWLRGNRESLGKTIILSHLEQAQRHLEEEKSKGWTIVTLPEIMEMK